MEHLIVYKDENAYCAFPDIERLPNGEIIVIFRKAIRREIATHIDSTSKAVAVRSKDNGKTWGEEIGVYDDEYGIQDPSIKILSDGTIISNFFKWKVVKQEPFNHKILGKYVVRSYDNGYTWEKEAVKVEIPDFKWIATSDAILELNDKTLLIPMYGAKEGERERAFILKSENKGSTWIDFRAIAFDPLGNMDFEEPALALLPSGKIICMMRVHGVEQYLWYSESIDNGNNWSIPRKTEIWGYPPHLLTLKDGRLLCSYGYRRPPYGIRACISYDEGKTWDLKNEIIIRSDGFHGDLGYTSSIELDNGEILTVYYFHDVEGIRFIAGSIYNI
ncbi:MAG: sialidase family protein [Nitrososphaerota archaeon]